jgi:hypothetical protein
MSANFTDVPPWRKGRGPVDNIPLLAEDPVLLSQPLQLGCYVFLPAAVRLMSLLDPASVEHRTGVDRPIPRSSGISR